MKYAVLAVVLILCGCTKPHLVVDFGSLPLPERNDYVLNGCLSSYKVPSVDDILVDKKITSEATIIVIKHLLIARTENATCAEYFRNWINRFYETYVVDKR